MRAKAAAQHPQHSAKLSQPLANERTTVVATKSSGYCCRPTCGLIRWEGYHPSFTPEQPINTVWPDKLTLVTPLHISNGFD